MDNYNYDFNLSQISKRSLDMPECSRKKMCTMNPDQDSETFSRLPWDSLDSTPFNFDILDKLDYYRPTRCTRQVFEREVQLFIDMLSTHRVSGRRNRIVIFDHIFALIDANFHIFASSKKFKRDIIKKIDELRTNYTEDYVLALVEKYDHLRYL